MESNESVVIDGDDPVVSQSEPEQVDELVEDVDRDPLQSIVCHGEQLHSRLTRKRFSVEAGQTIVVKVQSAESARIPHHDVFQLWQSIVPQIQVLQLSQSAESLSLDLRDSIVLQIELRQ